MQDAVCVGDAEGIGELHGNRNGLGLGQRPLGQARGEGLPFGQLEDDRHLTIHLDDVVDGGDRRMTERGGGAGLGEELVATVRGAGLRAGDGLERDVPAQARVLGEDDRAHAALSEFAEDAIRADGGTAQQNAPLRAGARDPAGPTRERRGRRPRAGLLDLQDRHYCCAMVALPLAAMALLMAATVWSARKATIFFAHSVALARSVSDTPSMVALPALTRSS